MEMKINGGEYNPCQYNLTRNLDANGRLLSSSEMYNLRGETPKEIYKAFLELKGLIDGKEDKPEKKVKNKPEKEKKKDKTEQKKDNPGLCPKCSSPLVEKQGISSKNGRPYHFFSCSAWPICDFTKPFLTEKEKNMPCDEDLLMVDEK